MRQSARNTLDLHDSRSSTRSPNTGLTHPLGLWAGQVCGHGNILQKSGFLGGSPARMTDVKNQQAAHPEQACCLGHPARMRPPISEVKCKELRLQGRLLRIHRSTVESRLSWDSLISKPTVCLGRMQLPCTPCLPRLSFIPPKPHEIGLTLPISQVRKQNL